MKAVERRKAIAMRLSASPEAIPGGKLSEEFGVSRQIIVQDIAVLKGSGFDIISTHSGYLLRKSPHAERVFKLNHNSDNTEDEMNTIVDMGASLVDVFVWHKVYGKISAPLNIFSRLGVTQFLEGVRSGQSIELMSVTGGYHYHTVRAETEEVLDAVGAALKAKGYLVDEE